MNDDERLKFLEVFLRKRARNQTLATYTEAAACVGMKPHSQAFHALLYRLCDIDKVKDRTLLSSLVKYAARAKGVGEGFRTRAYPKRYDCEIPSPDQFEDLLQQEREKIYRYYCK